jgi:hypothetical protein
MGAMCIERMEHKGAAAGPPVICGLTCRVWAGVKQPATGHLVLKERRKAEAGAPPMLILPILELDQQSVIWS